MYELPCMMVYQGSSYISMTALGIHDCFMSSLNVCMSLVLVKRRSRCDKFTQNSACHPSGEDRCSHVTRSSMDAMSGRNCDCSTIPVGDSVLP
jgi:hypothetical protein